MKRSRSLKSWRLRGVRWGSHLWKGQHMLVLRYHLNLVELCNQLACNAPMTTANRLVATSYISQTIRKSNGRTLVSRNSNAWTKSLSKSNLKKSLKTQRTPRNLKMTATSAVLSTWSRDKWYKTWGTLKRWTLWTWLTNTVVSIIYELQFNNFRTNGCNSLVSKMVGLMTLCLCRKCPSICRQYDTRNLSEAL